jgi:DNA polymerase-3 subunit delta
VKDYGDLALETLDGEEAEYDRIREALESVPFLSARKMVVLKNASASKEFTENAETLLADLPEITDVVVVEPKLDKRLSYYKYLKKATDFREFGELDERGLARWLVDTSKASGASLSLGDASFLVQRVGTNQQLLASELEKLATYNPKITRETIELLTEPSPQSKIFDLLDAAFAGNHKKALALYQDQRQQNVAAQQIIAMLAWQLHILALAKTASGRSPDAIASEAKISPYVAKKSASAASKLPLAKLKTLVAELATLDRRLKSENLDADEALQHYLLKLAI